MPSRQLVFLGAASLAALAASACADAPTTPAATAPRLAPSAAYADAAPAVAGPGDVLVNGVAFADVEARGGWMERFNLNTADQSTWHIPPIPWRPADPTQMGYIAVHSVTPNSLADWAIVRHTRDREYWYAPEPMMAWHDGMTCDAPPLTHPVASYDDYPFLCRNHMMTATNASGYGVTYLTPNRLVNVGTGDAVVRFDMTTLKSSSRDWVDLWVTPYDANLVVPLDDTLPDGQGYPKFGLHVRMVADRDHSRFEASVIVNHHAVRLTPSSVSDYEASFASTPATPGGDVSIDGSLATSATRRDTFELRLSDGHVRFGMPRYGLWWLDVPLLSAYTGSSTLAVVQIGHHSFNPSADGGTPDTWHWDNIGMAPAVQFSIINATRRYVDGTTTPRVDFVRPAPPMANLRFAGYGANFEVSFNGGKWQKAERQDEELKVNGRFHSYWTPVPMGTVRVDFRAENDPADKKTKPAVWMARDITIWSQFP